MTSGFDCNDYGEERWKCEKRKHESDDWVDFALNLSTLFQIHIVWDLRFLP